jgi:hypothetical protein
MVEGEVAALAGAHHLSLGLTNSTAWSIIHTNKMNNVPSTEKKRAATRK